MNVLRLGLALCAALACLPRDAAAITTNLGQEWSFEPDAWVRGNDADTSWFGWDAMDGNNGFHPGPPPEGFFRILDDDTPDVGDTTPGFRRLFQGNDGADDPTPTMNGHRSSSGSPSGNYYSFDDDANDTIEAIAPASGDGVIGFTTVVLQVLGQGGEPIEDLQFALDPNWTLAKSLYAKNADGAGMYWLEWYQAGADLPISIHMTSASPHRAIDAFQVDTFWTSESSPRNNVIAAIPEPGTMALAGIAIASSLIVLRKRRTV